MDVPPFSAYYSTRGDMSVEQRQFYDYLVGCFRERRFPKVDGNISYLFAYTYGLMKNWKKKGYGTVYNDLLDIAEAYYDEPNFSEYCKLWAYDCLIGQGKDEECLRLSEPVDIFKAFTLQANLRCNAAFRLGRDASAVDLFMVISARVTSYAKKHQTVFRDLLVKTFEEEVEKNGLWLPRFYASPSYTYYLFRGTSMWPKPSHTEFQFSNDPTGSDAVQAAVREAENRLRDAHKVPRVGEGWVSETELFHAVRQAFPETQVIQHGRPDWLGRQHLDIWLPRWNITVEYHGDQHFEAVEYFGGAASLAATQERDARKVALCQKNNAILIVALPTTPHEEVIASVISARSETQPPLPERIGDETP